MESLSRDLTPNIREFMDSAEHGVVLFTMGFIFNAKVDMNLTVSVKTFTVIFTLLLTYPS